MTRQILSIQTDLQLHQHLLWHTNKLMLKISSDGIPADSLCRNRKRTFHMGHVQETVLSCRAVYGPHGQSHWRSLVRLQHLPEEVLPHWSPHVGISEEINRSIINCLRFRIRVRHRQLSHRRSLPPVPPAPGGGRPVPRRDPVGNG